jgi:hypothetical protein
MGIRTQEMAMSGAVSDNIPNLHANTNVPAAPPHDTSDLDPPSKKNRTRRTKNDDPPVVVPETAAAGSRAPPPASVPEMVRWQSGGGTSKEFEIQSKYMPPASSSSIAEKGGDKKNAAAAKSSNKRKNTDNVPAAKEGFPAMAPVQWTCKQVCISSKLFFLLSAKTYRSSSDLFYFFLGVRLAHFGLGPTHPKRLGRRIRGIFPSEQVHRSLHSPYASLLSALNSVYVFNQFQVCAASMHATRFSPKVTLCNNLSQYYRSASSLDNFRAASSRPQNHPSRYDHYMLRKEYMHM